MTRRRAFVTTSVFFLLSVSSGLLATERYVAPPPLGSNKNPGTEELPFATIQRGINVSSNGDTVIVAAGTYLENIRFNGKNILLKSTDPLDPAVVANTIIDGNQGGSVVSFSGNETEACVLSGFTIRNGAASNGGGICGGTLSVHTQAQIEYNVITGSTAVEYGGGLCYCDGTIEKNTITGNSAGSGGGGVDYCSGTMQNNTIVGNSARVAGGGLNNCNGTIENNTIVGNSAPVQAGGLCVCGGTIENNTIANNSADYGGGLSQCQGTIQNNTITGNSASWGGGLYGCSGTVQNNTITDNSAGGEGGGLYECSGVIRNNIVWANSAPRDPQLCRSNMPTYSCIEGWSRGGQGNIASDPRFVRPDAGDYRLQGGSPCIDAGANYYWFAWPQRDADGNCRLVGLAVDMGCYEYGSSTDADGDLASDADESAAGTNPFRDDSDADGLRDGLELLRGSNPLELTARGVLHVPSDFATIQKSLCVSITGDEIIVAPGTYPENLQFCGPDIILRSSDPGDPNVVGSTILDGGGVGPVVCFAGGESEVCVLTGFTMRNGDTSEGGGINGNRTLATIQKNTITGNSALGGGGLCGCDGTIRNNTIIGNWAQYNGGGLWGCNGTIQGNTISANSADYGGGLYMCNGTIQNNTITGNTAVEYAGGLNDCDGTIQNNTITANSAADEAGGLAFCNGTIQNCIVWGNSAPTGPQLDRSSVPTYSCIQGWTGGGEGNISPKNGPEFVNPTGHDYHLQPGSPCIDAGVNEDWMWTACDLDGNLRVALGVSSLTVDMGAYEYGSWPFRISQLLLQGTGNIEVRWESRPGDEYVIWSCTDLTSALWTQEQTVPSAGDSTSWTDPSPGGSRKFYRVQLE